MIVALAVFALLAVALHLLSIALAARRVRLRRSALPAPAAAPAVTVIRTVCGIEAFSRETLGSSFALDYPNYELLFCGWDAAQNEWIIMADSNVLTPCDYIQRLLARWRDNTGVVCSVPILPARIGMIETVALVAALAALWFGAEAALARAAGWHWSMRMALACVLRDVLLPLLWVDAWLGSSFTWRGTEMRPREAIEATR